MKQIIKIQLLNVNTLLFKGNYLSFIFVIRYAYVYNEKGGVTG